MSRLGDHRHRDVSLPEMTPRIGTVRRTFSFASALVAALSFTWPATPTSAASLASSLSPGSSPAQLSAFAGGGEQAAIAAAGSGNAATTTPADPSIAEGASDVVEAVNSAVFVYSRTGGSALATFDINNMVRTSSGWAVQDPKVVYDPFSGRFILAVLQYNAARSGCTNDGSEIAVVASNADPTAAWQTPRTFNNLASLGPGDGPVATDVSLGMTSTVVALAWDYSSCLSGNPVASQTDIVQRADLATGSLGVNSARAFTEGPLGIQPAMGLGLSSVEYEIVNDANCMGAATSTYAVFSYAGSPEAQNVTGPTCATTGSEPSGTNAPPAASQGGTSATLQTGDDRFLDLVWGSNMLWATGNWGCTPSGDTHLRSCINVVTATATTAGAVSSPTQLTPEGVNGAYLYYPSVALDSSGNAILTFDESSSSALESMQLASINGGAWSTFTTLHTSADYYSPGGCSSCAWGAYSGAVQDPLHPTDVWVVSSDNDGNSGTSCATVNTCWNTFIARYTFAGPSISSLTPSSGSGGGGQVVTVAGSDFATGTTVTFAGSPITVSNLTPDSFTFTTPPEPPGPSLVYAVATDSLGSSTQNTASSYLYVPLANYVPVNPFRILDTRSTPPTPLGPNATRTIHVTGLGSPAIPGTAVAAVLNVTAVSGTASSLLALYPAGTVKPSVSDLNFAAGTVTPNLVTVTLGTNGEVTIFNSLGTVNVVVDVEGYFAPPGSPTPAGEFHPIAPTRVCDTRYSTYACHGAIAAGTARRVTVAQGTIPSDGTAAAAVLNLTAVAGTAATYLTVYPTSSNGTCATTVGLPGVSTINVTPGAVEANRVMVELGPAATGGEPTSVCVYNAAGTINVVLDANGWYGTASATAGYQYQAIAPSRICDTRQSYPACSTGAIGAGASRLVAVAGQGGVPTVGSGTVVQAVIANLTGIAPTQSTYLVGYSAALSKAPGSSDINLSAGAVRPNLIVVQLDTAAGPDDGFMELFNAAGSVNAAVDIQGWFQ